MFIKTALKETLFYRTVFRKPKGRATKFGSTLLVLFVFTLSISSSALAESNMTELSKMFEWWNKAIKDPNGFTVDAFRPYFNEDASIVINGKVRGSGIEELVTHFKKLQPNRESVVVHLPFIEEFKSGNKIFTHHRMTVKRDGLTSKRQLMGYAVVEGGKLSLVNLISYTESEQ